MAKNSKITEISIATHDGSHFITFFRNRTDGGKEMFHTSTAFVSLHSVRRAQMAQIALLPQVKPWQEKCNAWKRVK